MEQLGYLFAACFAMVNLPYTILLIMVLIYWGLVILGAVSMDSLDVDLGGDADVDADLSADMDGGAELDADGDLDADADADADGDAEGGHGGGFFHTLLMFFNVGEIPLMVFVSFFGLSMWVISLVANVMLHNESLLIGAVIAVPNVIVSAFLAKLFTTPIKKVFRALDKQTDIEPDDEVLGRPCVIKTSEANETFGQAVIETDGAPLTLNVITRPGQRFEQGQEVVVTDYIKNKNVYIVETLWDSEE